MSSQNVTLPRSIVEQMITVLTNGEGHKIGCKLHAFGSLCTCGYEATVNEPIAAARTALLQPATGGIPQGWLIRPETNGEISVCAPNARPGMIYAKSSAKALPERLLFALAQALLTTSAEIQVPIEAVAKIDPERVDAIFRHCLFKEGEDTSDHVKAEGISCNMGFHPERLASHKVEISALLDELPDEFKKSGGGGMSFLNAGNDRNGNQWTGLHKRMEQLILLGIGIAKVQCLMPRTMWAALPGGMPYYLVN